MKEKEIHDFISTVNEDNDGDVILISWCIQDVHHYTEQYLDCEKSPLTDEQARDILKNVLKTHDCTIGITWESFDSGIEHCFPEWCIKYCIDVAGDMTSKFVLDDNDNVATFGSIGQAEDYLGRKAIPFDTVEIIRYLGENYEY